MKPISCIILLLFFSLFSNAIKLQAKVKGFEDFAERKGFIYTKAKLKNSNGEEDSCSNFILKNDISLYNKPEGKIVGKITKGRSIKNFPCLVTKNSECILYDNKGDECIVYDIILNEKSSTLASFVNSSDIAEAEYASSFLVFYNKVDNYVQILKNSTPGGLWLSIEELERKDYIVVENFDYFVKNIDFFLKKKDFFHWFPIDNLVLRQLPEESSEVIAEIEELTLPIIKITGETEGDWARVIVQERKFTDKNEPHLWEPISSYKGWIKVIDDNGALNIWYPIRGM